MRGAPRGGAGGVRLAGSRTSSFTLRHRPFRIGFCVRGDELGDVAAAAQLATVLWGGFHSVLVPMDRLLRDPYSFTRDHRIDLLYAPGGEELIEGVCPHLSPRGLPAMCCFREVQGQGVYAQTLDVLPYLHHLWTTRFQFGSASNCTRVRWTEGDCDAPLLAVEFGTYEAPLRLALDYGAAFEQLLKAKSLEFGPDHQISEDLARTVTPIQLTRELLRLEPLRLRRSDGHIGNLSGGLFAGDSHDVCDLCDYWNLRAAGVPVRFLPIGGMDRWRPYLVAASEQVSRRLHFRMSGDEHPAASLWLPSRLMDRRDEIAAVAKSLLSRACVYVHEFPGLHEPPHARGVAFPSKVLVGSIEDFEHPHDECHVRVPVPPTPVEGMGDDMLNSQRWVLSVDRSYRTFSSETLPIPPHAPALNSSLARVMTTALGGVRSDEWGLGFVWGPGRELLSYFAKDGLSCAKSLLALAGYEARVSREGLKAQRVIDALGGLHACRILKLPGLRKLLRTNWEPCPKTRNEIADVIWRGKKSVAELSGYEHAVRGLTRGSRVNIDAVLRHLLGCGLLNPGVRPKCDRCQLNPWIPVDSVETKVTCEFCGNAIALAPQLTLKHGCRWEFRLSGVFGGKGAADGTIPVVLALHHLEASCMEHQVLLPSLDLEHLTSGARLEIDFMSVRSEPSGETCVIIGECKTGDKVEQEQLDARKTLLDSISKSLSVPAFLLIAKDSDRFEAAELASYREFAKTSKVILWSRSQLESEFIAAETSFATAEELAQFTRQAQLV